MDLLKKFNRKSPSPKKRQELIIITKSEFDRISGYFQKKVKYESARQVVNTINARQMFGEVHNG